MIFFKYEATGNDFLLLKGPISNPANTAQKICHRRFGIGADGMIIALHSDVADIKMDFYNSDGSQAPMCGNGLRAFAHFVYAQGFVSHTRFRVETMAGIHTVTLLENNQIRITLNKPQFTLDFPEVSHPQTNLSPTPLKVDNQTLTAYILNTGTLHTVIFVDDIATIDISTLGQAISIHPYFPNKTNVNFVQVLNQNTLKVVTYERGAGQTLSCGTGASASAIVAVHLSLTNQNVEIQVPGGQLHVKYDQNVELTGPQNFIAKVDYRGLT